MNLKEIRETARKYNFSMYKKRRGKDSYIFRSNEIIDELQFTATITNRIYAHWKDEKKVLFSINGFEQYLLYLLDNKNIKPKKQIKFVHDIYQILFLELGESLYYITRDLKVIKKIYKQTSDFNFVLIPAELNPKDQEMVDKLNLRFIWNDRVGDWERERERKILEGENLL